MLEEYGGPHETGYYVLFRSMEGSKSLLTNHSFLIIKSIIVPRCLYIYIYIYIASLYLHIFLFFYIKKKLKGRKR
jgi:hypothetical protein